MCLVFALGTLGDGPAAADDQAKRWPPAAATTRACTHPRLTFIVQSTPRMGRLLLSGAGRLLERAARQRTVALCGPAGRPRCMSLLASGLPKPRVVILGSGWAGNRLARMLSKELYDVTLVPAPMSKCWPAIPDAGRPYQRQAGLALTLNAGSSGHPCRDQAWYGRPARRPMRLVRRSLGRRLVRRSLGRRLVRRSLGQAEA